MPSETSSKQANSKFLQVRYGAHLPRLSRKLSRVVAPLNRFFDWLYQSEYNPLYRSGTLAVALLMVLIVTGVYLLCFYSVSQPYESVQRIAGQPIGAIIRALHRYSADLTVVVILFHILQLAAQGKTWGPRLRAWLSGVILTGMFFLAAWSGLVLVWDVQGQLVASAGGTLFATLPFLRDALRQAFDGSTPVGGSFFFVNLFLHAALPLGLLAGLWIHTSSLARARWFPKRAIFVGVLLAVLALALFVKPPLQDKADLLRLFGRIELDWWYVFWIPWLELISPAGTLATLAAAFFILLCAPRWLRPSTLAFSEPSFVHEARCTGCTQCATDCPWEAISMVPRQDGRRLMAKVSSHSCVSCGICAASCADQCIGPPQREAEHQLASAEAFIAAHAQRGMCLVACCNNGRMISRLQSRIEQPAHAAIFPVECCGTIHSRTTEKLLSHFERLAFVGCPERNCMNRDGLVLLSERVYERRVPFLERSLDRGRILLSSFSDGELGDLNLALERFEVGKNCQAEQVRLKSLTVQSILKKTIASALLLTIVAIVGRLPYGQVEQGAAARLSFRLPASMNAGCRSLTDEERRSIPRHMQKPQVCENLPVRYRATIAVNGVQQFEREVFDPAQRTDRPLLLSEDIPLPLGKHAISVMLKQEPEHQAVQAFHGSLEIEPGRIYLFRSINDGRGVFLVQQPQGQ